MSANPFNAPLSLSVVANILSLAPSTPYFFSMKSLNILKAIAGSVVVPDLDITLTETSNPSIASNKSLIYVELMLFPTKNTLGVFLALFGNIL